MDGDIIKRWDMGAPDELTPDNQLYIEAHAIKCVNMGYTVYSKMAKPRWVIWYNLHFENGVEKEYQWQIWEEHIKTIIEAGWKPEWSTEWFGLLERTELDPPIRLLLKPDGEYQWELDSVDKALPVSQLMLPGTPEEKHEVEY